MDLNLIFAILNFLLDLIAFIYNVFMEKQKRDGAAPSLQNSSRIDVYVHNDSKYQAKPVSDSDMNFFVALIIISALFCIKYYTRITVILSVLIMIVSLFIFFPHIKRNRLSSKEYLLLILSMAINEISVVFFYLYTSQYSSDLFNNNNNIFIWLLEHLDMLTGTLGIIAVAISLILTTLKTIGKKRVSSSTLIILSISSCLLTSGFIYGLLKAI